MYLTKVIAQAKVLKGDSNKLEAVKASLKEKYGFEPQPQMDLLYVESCLVTAGKSHGKNGNDDIFTAQETWAARFSPLLKPANWQHVDKDIVGVTFSVQARDLSGNILDINAEKAPDCEFELWTEAVIFKLIHPERAQEIEERANANNLYVSMEAWFNDYSYGLSDDNGLFETIARNKDTSFLDTFLKACGGNGVYCDQETGKTLSVGRVLREITFGGFGFVDSPANPRSVISEVSHFESKEYNIAHLLDKMLTSSLMEEEMKTQGSNNEQVAEIEVIKARAAEVEAQNADLTAKIQALTTEKDVEIKALQAQVSQYESSISEFCKSIGAKEIDQADNAKTAQELFQIRLNWIKETRASLTQKVDQLQANLNQIALAKREQEIRVLFGDKVSKEAVDTFVAHAKSLSEVEYGRWSREKELLMLELSKTEASQEQVPVEEPAPVQEEEYQDVFASLLEKRRSELSRGAKANASLEKNAGSTKNDTVEELNSSEDDTVNLAGASVAEEDQAEVADAFRSLAQLIVNNKNNSKGE